jgi:VWFA-related protein
MKELGFLMRKVLNPQGLGKFLAVALMLAGLCVSPLPAQQPQPSPGSTSEPLPEAGGPAGDTGPYSIPRKPKEPPPPEKPRPAKNPPELGEITITKDVGLVNVDVVVTTKEGQFIPGLSRQNFKVFEDGVLQQITDFSQSQAPVTAVLLVEFANTMYPFMVDALNASYTFAEQLRPDDWIAVVYYDLRPHILTDFTQDKRAVYAALAQLRIPSFRETNLYDALYDTLDRLEGVEGRKYIILVSSGRDTFSKLNYDKVLKKIEGSRNITIFPISTGRAFREWVDARYGANPNVSMAMMDYLQADNSMNTFAKLSGGRAYFPRFQAEFAEIFRDIGASIRNQYNLGYHPTNTKLDGSYRRLKVELVDPKTGGALKLTDAKGKPLKYVVIAREGYTARHAVE